MNELLHYYKLPGRVKAFSTTRHGGVSEGLFGTFNINPYCGDAPAAVAENRRILAAALHIKPNEIFLPHQVHGVTCRVIDADFLRLGKVQQTTQLEGVDAVMTAERGVCIGVSTADCIPVLLYDKVNNAAAAVHAGWRGTVQRIVEKVFHHMECAFGTRSADVIAVIGPGISLKNFEIGDEVYEAFKAQDFNMRLIARRYAKWHIDLPLCNRLQLECVGVPQQAIQMTGICTYDHVDDYFSARRLGTASGRIFTGIMLT